MGTSWVDDLNGTKLASEALSASKLIGEPGRQRAWLAERGSPYAAPGVDDALMTAAFLAHCCIMLRKLAELYRPPDTM